MYVLARCAAQYNMHALVQMPFSRCLMVVKLAEEPNAFPCRARGHNSLSHSQCISAEFLALVQSHDHHRAWTLPFVCHISTL